MLVPVFGMPPLQQPLRASPLELDEPSRRRLFEPPIDEAVHVASRPKTPVDGAVRIAEKWAGQHLPRSVVNERRQDLRYERSAGLLVDRNSVAQTLQARRLCYQREELQCSVLCPCNGEHGLRVGSFEAMLQSFMLCRMALSCSASS